MNTVPPALKNQWSLKAIAWLVAGMVLTCGLLGGYVSFHTNLLSASRKPRIGVFATPIVAPAPLPTALPLVGDSGRDRFGYPLTHVDQAAMRSLAVHGKLDELAHYISLLQAQFEEDATKEAWVEAAVEAARYLRGDRLRLLQQLGKKQRRSFVPYLLRGAYWLDFALAQSRSPGKDEQAKAEEAYESALIELDHALHLKPKLAVAMTMKMVIFGHFGTHEDLLRLAREADRACPLCLSTRLTYLNYLKPRWNGSYDEMAAYARPLSDSSNLRLRSLGHLVDSERGTVALAQHRLEDAINLFNKACSSDCLPEILLQRARAKMKITDWAGAKTDLESVVGMSPNSAAAKLELVNVYVRLKQFDLASQQLNEALRIDPLVDGAAATSFYLVSHLLIEGCAQISAGKHLSGLHLLDLARELEPRNMSVRANRIKALAFGLRGTPEEFNQLQAEIAAHPEDILQVQRLSNFLAYERRPNEIPPLWTNYLKTHPDSGLAYAERSEAYARTGKRQLAEKDAVKACDLGENIGCTYLSPIY